MSCKHREEKRKTLFFCNFVGYRETNPSFPIKQIKNFSELLQARIQNNLLFTYCSFKITAEIPKEPICVPTLSWELRFSFPPPPSISSQKKPSALFLLCCCSQLNIWWKWTRPLQITQRTVIYFNQAVSQQFQLWPLPVYFLSKLCRPLS